MSDLSSKLCLPRPNSPLFYNKLFLISCPSYAQNVKIQSYVFRHVVGRQTNANDHMTVVAELITVDIYSWHLHKCHSHYLNPLLVNWTELF